MRAKVALAGAAVLLALVGAVTVTKADGRGDAKTYSAHTSFAFDVSNKRKLAGFAEQVFVGRVIEKIGEEGKATTNPGTVIPQTQFRVEVLEVIEGTISDEVVVNQQGGYDPEDNSVLLMENDPLLQRGATYLFLTRTDPEKQWLAVVAPGYADIRMTSPEQRERVVSEFRVAVANQERPYG